MNNTLFNSLSFFWSIRKPSAISFNLLKDKNVFENTIAPDNPSFFSFKYSFIFSISFFFNFAPLYNILFDPKDNYCAFIPSYNIFINDKYSSFLFSLKCLFILL